MIPKTIAEADTAWLSDVLGASVSHIEANQIGQGVGIMGDIYRLKLRYASDASGKPSSVVLKLPSSFEENRAQGVALGMFEAEVRFYNELADRASVGIPEVYRAEIISGQADFVIVMEDLTAATLVSQTAGMNPKQAAAAVRVLASIHATWWDAVQVDELAWIPTMDGPRIEFVDQYLPTLMSAFADGFGAGLPKGGLEIFETFVGNYLKINKVLADRSPWTLVHQDFRVENLLFDEGDSSKVSVLDWQGIGRGPGAYDLAYLLGGSMTVEDRRASENELLAIYHQRLVDEGVARSGVAGMSLEQCKEDYALAQLMGGLATSILLGGAMDLSNERGVALVTTMACRHAQAALDHDGLALMQNII